MKTNIIDCPAVSSNSFHGTKGISRLANFGRLLLATSCVSLVSFAAVPSALADGINGTYRFTSATGSLKLGDETYNISDSLAKRIVDVSEGKITIQEKTLQLNRSGVVKIIRNLADDFNVDVDTSVKGPSTLVLNRIDTSTFRGETTRPIVVSFQREDGGSSFSGELRTNVAATVKFRNNLRVVIKFSGDAFGQDFSGRLVIVAKR